MTILLIAVFILLHLQSLLARTCEQINSTKFHTIPRNSVHFYAIPYKSAQLKP